MWHYLFEMTGYKIKKNGILYCDLKNAPCFSF